MGVPGHFPSVGPLECIFMALLALFNEGVPGHLFHLMEAPTMRLQTQKDCSVGLLDDVFMALLESRIFL